MPAVPAFDHIFVIIMENHSASQIIGSADAPFISELAAGYGLAANYTAISHPSLPNYLALTGGSTFGLSTDCTDCFQNAPNIAVDRVAASGRAWRAYIESMPSPAFVGDAYVQDGDRDLVPDPSEDDSIRVRVARPPRRRCAGVLQPTATRCTSGWWPGPRRSG